MEEFSMTQCFALAHIYEYMKNFLYDYAEGRIDKKFFLTSMDGMIDYIDNIVRENGSYSCSCRGRALMINEDDCKTKSVK